MKTVQQSLSWPIIIAVAGITVSLVVMADSASPLRPLLVFGFLLICPGMAFVRLLHLKERFVEFLLAVALSLVINTLVSEILVLMRIWSLAGSVLAIVTVSITGVALQLITMQRATVAAGD